MSWLKDLIVDWPMWTAIAMTVATSAYVVLVGITLRYVRVQLNELKKNRTLQATLAVYKELQIPEARAARRYIYEEMPAEIEHVPEDDLKQRLLRAEPAIVAFDIVGGLLQAGYLDPAPIIATHWVAIWRCWKKSEKLISQIGQERGDPTFYARFGYLFGLSERYRIANNYEEPKL